MPPGAESPCTAISLDVPDEVIALVEPHEPTTTYLLAPLVSRGLSRTCRTWVLRVDGDAVGAIVVTRATTDHWTAQAHVEPGYEEVAAPVLAAVLDASPAVVCRGTPATMHLVRHRLRRIRGWRPRGGVAAVTLDRARDRNLDGTRMATPDDVRGLVALFAAHPTLPHLTPWHARRWLVDLVGRDGVAIAEHDGRIVGALTTFGHTHRWLAAGTMVIAPGERERHVARALVERGVDLAHRQGLGAVAEKAPTGGVLRQEHDATARIDVILAPRQRVRGQRRVTDALTSAVRATTWSHRRA
jgi:hypothetical protein